MNKMEATADDEIVVGEGIGEGESRAMNLSKHSFPFCGTQLFQNNDELN